MFLDANIFINAFHSTGRTGQLCRKLLGRITNGEQVATTSPLVLDEVLYFFIDAKGLAFAERILANLLKTESLHILSVDRSTLLLLPQYLKQGLAPRDALHAATMHANAIDAICSFDHDFDRIKGISRQEPK